MLSKFERWCSIDIASHPTCEACRWLRRYRSTDSRWMGDEVECIAISEDDCPAIEEEIEEDELG